MTTVVMLVEGSEVIAGGDGQITAGSEIQRTGFLKVGTPSVGWCWGISGEAHFVRMVSQFEWPESEQVDDVEAFLYKDFLPSARAHLKEIKGGAEPNHEGISEVLNILVGHSSKSLGPSIWCIQSNFTVGRNGSSASIGTGREYALGALEVKRDVAMALEAAAMYDIYTNSNHMFVSTGINEVSS